MGQPSRSTGPKGTGRRVFGADITNSPARPAQPAPKAKTTRLLSKKLSLPRPVDTGVAPALKPVPSLVKPDIKSPSVPPAAYADRLQLAQAQPELAPVEAELANEISAANGPHKREQLVNATQIVFLGSSCAAALVLAAACMTSPQPTFSADLDQNGSVDVEDLITLTLAHDLGTRFGDADGDGETTVNDLMTALSEYASYNSRPRASWAIPVETSFSNVGVPPVSIDCVGAWSHCEANCLDREYTVAISQSGTGAPCYQPGTTEVVPLDETGFTSTETRACEIGMGNCRLPKYRTRQLLLGSAAHWARKLRPSRVTSTAAPTQSQVMPADVQQEIRRAVQFADNGRSARGNAAREIGASMSHQI